MPPLNTSDEATACLTYNTTFHPCPYPFISLPNSSVPCMDTFADGHREAFDAARIVFFAAGTPVLGRYAYLLWHICRYHYCHNDRRTVKFIATDKVVACGFLCMLAWSIRALDAEGSRAILPYWISGMLVTFCQNTLVTALIVLVRSWLSTISSTLGRTAVEGAGSSFLFWVTIFLLWVVHFLLLEPMQHWLLDKDVFVLGGVYNGTVNSVLKLVGSAIMISYCSMALVAGLKIVRGLKDLEANAAKAKRTIFSYIVVAFGCVLLACVYNFVTAVSNFGKIVVESPPCTGRLAFMQFSQWIAWITALVLSAIVRIRRPPPTAAAAGTNRTSTSSTARGGGHRNSPPSTPTPDVGDLQFANPLALKLRAGRAGSTDVDSDLDGEAKISAVERINPLHGLHGLGLHIAAGDDRPGGVELQLRNDSSAKRDMHGIDVDQRQQQNAFSPRAYGPEEEAPIGLNPENVLSRVGRLRTASSSASSILSAFVSASAESLSPAHQARRAREWCQTEGCWGAAIIVTLSLMIINLLVIGVLHCTSILDWVQGRPGILRMLLVFPVVVVGVGVICSTLLLRVLWALVSVTCRHGATHAEVGKRLRDQRKSSWRLGRMWQLYEMYTSPGGRFFDLWEFSREVFESILQILAVREYANNGVDRAFLDIYVCVVGINALSAVALILPQCAPKRWNRMSRESRARRERVVLTLDVVCDALYAIFPTLYLAISLYTVLYGKRGDDLCDSMQMVKQNCKDLQALTIMPQFVEMMLGGRSPSKILLKLATRLIPLWFAASRAVEVVEALAVARETKKLARMAPQRRKFKPRKNEQEMVVPAGSGFFDEITTRKLASGTAKKSTGKMAARPTRPAQSVISLRIDRERTERSTRPQIPVPVWLVCLYVSMCWTFCLFSWIRFSQLAAPCAAAGSPWQIHCRVRSHPLFDLKLPGPGTNLCACNTFIAVSGKRKNQTKENMNSSYDCGAGKFMEDVRQGLFAGNALTTTAPYVQSMMFYSGCAVNNTHVNEMFVGLKNLRILTLRDSSAIVPPLRLPGGAMKKESQLMALQLVRIAVEVIPPEIGRLSEALSLLYIRGGKMRELPRELGMCTNLALLYLNGNALSTLPSELGRLRGLASIGLSNNKLNSLPDELGYLTGMQTLQLSGNLLTMLPPSFVRMSSLGELHMADNRLTAVPVIDSQPRAWPNLMYMNVEGNDISAWPNDWLVHSNVSVAGLLFNTTARAMGDERGGLYDTYVEEREEEGAINSTDVPSLLVLMSGNPIMKSNNTDGRGGGGVRLLEVSRGRASKSGTGELPRMLVSSRAECTTGCPSTPWKARGLEDWRGDSICDMVCNASACAFDGGDCVEEGLQTYT